MRNTVIIGGGLAGLISGIQLSREGIPCLLIEKKSYPNHRVCGEYISNEAVPFLKSLDLYPAEFSPPQINRFQLSTVTGKNSFISLDLGGFGISRFAYDNFLYQKALNSGVEFLLNTEVEHVDFQSDKFLIRTQVRDVEADLVLGAFGKRSRLDHSLQRNFVKKRSPYAGIKYHIRTGHPADLIALHNFVGGYCGISNVENGVSNLCYLTRRESLRKTGSIEALEREILFQNPLLKSIFTDSDFLFEKPEVINEISFETKSPVEHHILMVGDAAGMIAPLCGNGMAMAIHASKLVSQLAKEFCARNISRKELEGRYVQQWNRTFSHRLWRGRQIQKLFGNETLSRVALSMILYSRPLADAIVRSTHGAPF